MSQSSKRCSRKIKQAIVLVEFILRQEKQKTIGKTVPEQFFSIIFRLLRRFTGPVNDTFTFYSLEDRKASICS